jgi:two-component system, NarL family, sensor kinase
MPARPMTPAHASVTHASGGASAARPRFAVGSQSVPLDADVRTQLELLSQMVEDISGELALEPLLARLVERACNLIGADDGAIGLYVPERDVIRTAASHAIPAAQLHAELPRGHGLTGRVLELGTPLRCRYGDLPHPVRGAAKEMSMIGMPIVSHGELIGVFGIGAWPPKQLGDTEQELLEHFARHAAIAIVNARRYSDEQRRAARFAMIARVAGIIASETEPDPLLQRAADAIHELLGFARVDIPLIEPPDQHTLVFRIRGGEYKRIREVYRLPMSRGIIGAAARTRRAQLVNDVADDPLYVKPPGTPSAQAELAVPMLYGDELLGVINVEGDRLFDDLDRMSLVVVAEHLAVAIHNARLSEQAQRLAVLEERQRLARELHDNVTQILSSISLIAQSLNATWRKDPRDGERRAERLGELAQMAFAEMRALLQELTPGEAPPGVGFNPAPPHVLAGAVLTQHGLATAVTRLLPVMVPGNLSLHLDFDGYVPQVVRHEQALLRVCQEAVSNVIQHAGAERVRVTVRVDGQRVQLNVADDGRGVAAGAPRGLGLASMERRLVELGGSLTLGPRAPQGTVLEATMPRRDRDSPG